MTQDSSTQKFKSNIKRRSQTLTVKRTAQLSTDILKIQETLIQSMTQLSRAQHRNSSLTSREKITSSDSEKNSSAQHRNSEDSRDIDSIYDSRYDDQLSSAQLKHE